MYEDEPITFTLSEARNLLPTVRTLISRMVREYEALSRIADEVSRAREKADLGGGTPQGVVYLTRLSRFSEAAAKVQSLGILIKDVKTGLIDFPCEFEGRTIYLCWRLGEEDIDWWHEIEAGFAGRQLLPDDFN